MNTLKPLLVVAVLAGIGYGVYVRINGGNDAPPPGVTAGWEAPKVQIPEAPLPTGPVPFSGGQGHPGGAPAYAGAPAADNGAMLSRNGEAPQYQAPPAGNNPYAPPGNQPGGMPVNGAPPYGAPPYGAAPGGAPPGAAPAYAGQPGAPPYNDPNAMPPQSPDQGGVAQGSPYAAPPQDPAAGMPVGGAPPVDPYGAGAQGAPPSGFAAAMESARRELEAGQMASALRQLSSWYEDPQLSAAERQQLTQALDQVAGTVVYSTQHLLEAPYEVQPGERLEDIGERYGVPWQLLAKINGIEDPQNLRAGERLKVVRGPFSAVVSVEKRQLTLLLADGSYAGRFPIGVGREHPPQEGDFAVSDKVVNPVYHGRDRAAGAGDPTNPLGLRWIGLGSTMGIHGTDRPENIGRNDLAGSISLSPRDADDVFDILSIGSRVMIRR